MALVLLAGGSSLLLLASGTVARLVDEATLQDLALRAEAAAAVGVAANPCEVSAGAGGRFVHPRVELREEMAVRGPLRLLRLHTLWRARALAGGRTRERSSSTAGWCE